MPVSVRLEQVRRVLLLTVRIGLLVGVDLLAVRVLLLAVGILLLAVRILLLAVGVDLLAVRILLLLLPVRIGSACCCCCCWSGRTPRPWPG